MRRALTLVASALLLVIAAGCGDNQKAREETKAKPEAKVSTNVRNGSAHETDRIYSLALHVEQTSLNRDRNTTVNVTALYDDNKTEDVTHRVEWRVEPKGAAEIEGHTLKAKEDTNATVTAELDGVHSNPVKLNIYWEVNGHRLPPEPDPKINNATLLGVDVNHNGVRDDVERKVYATYKKAIERAVMMQAFRTEQAMLADPDLIKNAEEWEKRTWKAFSCKNYLSEANKMHYIKSTTMSNYIENNQYNTEERVKKYFEYDQALSGGVYSINEGTLQDCEFDVERVLEMDR